MDPKQPFKWRYFQFDIILLCVRPRVINVDKNAAYPKAIDKLKAEQTLTKTTELRPVKYFNNIVEQDHRGSKQLVNPGIGFGSFNTARRTLRGYEAMNTVREGQIQGVAFM